MKQPLSRSSFDRLRGYLGVYLQEGAPLVDALWNESADIQALLLGDALLDAGADGTAGCELRIDPVVQGDSKEGGEGRPRLVDLVIRGGPGRFYCGGLPILWPVDRPFGAQSVDQRSENHDRHWLDRLERNRVYPIHVEAWVETVDALDRPDLDDPALFIERGSFRTRVCACVRLGEPRPLHSNLLLTVQGSYVDDRNLRYRVDLLEGVDLGDPSRRVATILWDDAGAALVARVVERAPAYARSVSVSDPWPFTPGTFARFEGAGVDGSVYEVTGQDAISISVRRHVCRERVVSLARCSVLVEPAPEAGQWLLDVGNGEAVAQLRDGDRVGELPADAATAIDVQTLARLRVASVTRGSQPDRVRVLLAPDGLAAAVEPWNEAHASTLKFPAHPFHTCVEVAARPEWSEGMRVRLHAQHTQREAKLEFHDRGGRADCAPGSATVESYEDRRIARIIRHGDTMTLRLDQPLAFEHGVGDRVVPERHIRARHYQGHECAVPIDAIDPDFRPTEDNHEGPYELGGSYVLPTGLSLRLSVDAREPSVVLVPGDGWSFVARAGGWVEAPVFDPVEAVRRAVTPLAELTLREDGFSLIDLRPVPASRAHHGWLATIAEAADEVALVWPEWNRIVLLARSAQGMRAQRELIPVLREMVAQGGGAGYGETWDRGLESLSRALEAVHKSHVPTDVELSRIAAVMARLGCAVGCGAVTGGGEDKRPRTPSEMMPEAPSAPPESKAARVPKPPLAPEWKPLELEPNASDIAALPTRLLRATTDLSSKQLAEFAAEWPTLGSVPTAGSLGNKRKRRFAEAVATLLDRTAELGAKAGARGGGRAALETELDELWREAYEVDRLESRPGLDAAIALAAGRAGGEP